MDYRARFLIEGKETTPSQHAEEKPMTYDDDFEDMTPREALEFIREASQTLGVTPQPKRYTGGVA